MSYKAPVGAPPDQESERAPPTYTNLLEPVDPKEYQKLLPYTYLGINTIQCPDVAKEYQKLLPGANKKKSKYKSKMSSMFVSKEDKKLAKEFGSKLIAKNDRSDYVTKRFYNTESDILNTLEENQCLSRIKRLAAEFNLQGKEFLFYELCQACLYDIYFYIDNSGSMRIDNRLEQLKLFLSLFLDANASSQPLRIRFMNYHNEIASGLMSDKGVDVNNISTQDQLNTVFESLTVSGGTPLANNLYDLILKPEVISRSYLVKPILIVIFTDGCPINDNKKLEKIIPEIQKDLKSKGLPKKSVFYQIAQIGDDEEATKYLDSLDDNHDIGDVIDCTSPIETELKQMSRTNKELSNEMNYVKKLILGPIDMTYDVMDEKF